MAVPKRKVSKARRDKRRSANFRLDAPTMVKCPKCGEYNLTHFRIVAARLLGIM